jgi:hypothetical protein
MAFDPFSGGGAPQGSHVVFAPIPVPPSHNWDWGRPQAAPSQPQQQQPPLSFSDAIQQALAERLEEARNPAARPANALEANDVRVMRASAEEAAKVLGNVVFNLEGIGSPRPRIDEERMARLEARRQEEEQVKAETVNTGALIAAEQAMDSMGSSASLGVARRLPGSPADGYRYMETLRHDQQITDERRAAARKMAKKDDEMAYRD